MKRNTACTLGVLHTKKEPSKGPLPYDKQMALNQSCGPAATRALPAAVFVYFLSKLSINI